MKALRHLLLGTILVLSLSVVSFAGDIETPGAPQPPPPATILQPDESGVVSVVGDLALALLCRLF